MMGTPNSLSSERADTSESLSSGWSASYSGILPLPLSGFGLGRDVLSSHEGSCGPLSLVELGFSFGRGFGRMSIGLDGVASGLYEDADSSKMTSRLTQTARAEGLKHLYAFFADVYPIRIHFTDFASNFSWFSFGMHTFAMLPNTLRCKRIGFLPMRISYGVSSCTPLVVHRFMR